MNWLQTYSPIAAGDLLIYGIIAAIAGSALYKTLYNPFTGLLLLIPLELWLSYVDVGPVPPRHYLIVVIFATIAIKLSLSRDIKMGRTAWSVFLFSLLFTIWVLLVDTLNGVHQSLTFHTIGILLSSIMIGVITYFLLNSKSRINTFLFFVFFIASISSAIAVFQFFNVEFFWQLRELMGIDSNSSIGKQIILRQRAPGLAYFSVSLSNQLALIVPVAFGILITRSFRSRRLLVTWILFLLMVGGLIATLTRSAFLGTGVGLLFVLAMYKKDTIPWKHLTAVLILMSATLIAVEPLRSRFFVLDESAFLRAPLAIAAILIGVLHPLGVGTGRHIRLYPEVFEHISRFPYAEGILGIAPHNQFLDVLVWYGFPGLLVLVSLYALSFGVLWTVWRNANDEWEQGVSLALSGGFISYVVNSFFHNAGLLTGDPFHWYFLGVVLALQTLHRRRFRDRMQKLSTNLVHDPDAASNQ